MGVSTWICRREFSAEPSAQGEPSAVVLKDSESNQYSDKGFRGHQITMTGDEEQRKDGIAGKSRSFSIPLKTLWHQKAGIRQI